MLIRARHALGAGLTLLALLAGPSPARAAEDPPAKQAAPADEAPVRKLQKELDDLLAVGVDAFELSARLRTGKVVRVTDAGSWPPDVQTSYAVRRDARKKVQLLIITPTSASGDWGFDATYLFDAAGQVLVFRRSFATFTSGCTSVARERVTSFFGAHGRLLSREELLVDDDGKPLSREKCDIHPPRHPMYPDRATALRQEGLR